MKVLGTNVLLYGEVLTKLRNMGYKGSHNQFRLICKCKSMADANRKVVELTGSNKTYETSYCSETANDLELELCEREDVWICIDGTCSNRYVSMKELLGKDKCKEKKRKTEVKCRFYYEDVSKNMIGVEIVERNGKIVNEVIHDCGNHMAVCCDIVMKDAIPIGTGKIVTITVED